MLSPYCILIFVNILVHYAVGDDFYHKHGSSMNKQYSAKETEVEKIVTLKLTNKFEDDFENTLEERIFDKIRTKLEAIVGNKFDELFSCCTAPQNKTEIQEAPQVNTDSVITETEGNNVTLRCIVAGGKPMPTIRWSFGNITIKSDVDRYRLLPDGSLEIPSLLLTDNGAYTCIGQNPFGIAQATVTLNVNEILVPPKISGESDITDMETKTATLRCTASGNPPPKITWRFGVNTINSTVDRYRLLPDGALEITSLYLNDSGVYTCIGENTVGTAEDTVTLKVTVPPQVTAESDVVEMESKTATLRCTATGVPVPKITWRFGVNTINSGLGRYHLLPDGALEISSLYLNDSGVYTCVAQNTVGSAEDTVSLNVTIPPQVTAESDVVEMQSKTTTLRCTASGVPVPKITWRFGAKFIKSDVDRYHLLPDGALEITSLYLNDSGVYTCVAQNTAGSAEDTVSLNVTAFNIMIDGEKLEQVKEFAYVETLSTIDGKHENDIENFHSESWKSVPPQISAESDVAEMEFKTATLRCTASGVPVPKITWRFGKNTINSDVDRYHLLPDGALEISSLYLNDSGVYTCVAQNTAGTAEDTVSLNVTVPPQVTAESDINEMETKKATLRCTASGTPAPKITWSFGGKAINSDVDRYRLLPDEALEITSLYLTDSGVYTCIAQNTAGTAQATITLTVRELETAPLALKTEEKITEMENKKIKMTCSFSGNPAPKITWSVGGATIDRDFDRYRLLPDGSLEITFLYRNDTGVYTCLAKNPLGTAQTTVTLTVTWNNDWCPATSATAASATNSVVAGTGVCGYHDLWVIRARHGTGLIPGKYDVHTTVASYALDGTEHITSEFEIFCSPDAVQWVKNTYGIPANAIIGGFTALGPSGDPLYIGRAVQGSYLTSGMVWNNVLYIPLNGVSWQQTSFEVLCRV